MKNVERACNEFVDSIHTAITGDDFRRVAQRTAHALGFRWFAYLTRNASGPHLISSYPANWTGHYFNEGYDEIDPVLQKPRVANKVVVWDGRDARSARSPRERRLFDDALHFKIRTGVTVRIPAGQNRLAAFTLSADERSIALDRFIDASQDLFQMIGGTFHAHVHGRPRVRDVSQCGLEKILLTQRQRQCLTWTSDGKTMRDIADLLGVSPRDVKFHLDNARKSLGALTLPHAVALGWRQGLLR